MIDGQCRTVLGMSYGVHKVAYQLFRTDTQTHGWSALPKMKPQFPTNNYYRYT